VNSFWMVGDRFKGEHMQNLRLRLVSNKKINDQIYNLSIIPEVVALIVKDVETTLPRDIIMATQMWSTPKHWLITY